MTIIIKGKLYPTGSKFRVIDTAANLFPLGSVVTYAGDFEPLINCYLFTGPNEEGDQIDRYLLPDQVEPLIKQGDPLLAALLGQRIPYPLGQHFKAFATIGDLLTSKAPRAYVVQCIKQTHLTAFERAALLALVDTTEIEQ